MKRHAADQFYTIVSLPSVLSAIILQVGHVQMQGSRQGIVEDLWAAVADYIDRMHARSDVAFNDATVQFAITSEV